MNGGMEGGGGGRADGNCDFCSLSLLRPPLPSTNTLLFLPDRVWDVVSAESRDARMSNVYKNIYSLNILGTMWPSPPGTSVAVWQCGGCAV